MRFSIAGIAAAISPTVSNGCPPALNCPFRFQNEAHEEDKLVLLKFILLTPFWATRSSIRTRSHFHRFIEHRRQVVHRFATCLSYTKKFGSKVENQSGGR